MLEGVVDIYRPICSRLHPPAPPPPPPAGCPVTTLSYTVTHLTCAASADLTWAKAIGAIPRLS